jgi:hypothetical protein
MDLINQHNKITKHIINKSIPATNQVHEGGESSPTDE